MMKPKTLRQKMYVVLSIIILFGSVVSAVAGVTVWHNKGDSITEGDVYITENLTVDGTVSGSNLTSGNNYIYSNLTGTPSGKQAYSYLIGVFPNSTYYAVNGTDNQYVVSWTSTNYANVFNNATVACASGGEIFVEKGNYTLSRMLTATADDLTIKSDGAWLVQADGANLGAMVQLLNCHKTIFEGFNLDGKKATNNGTMGIWIYATAYTVETYNTVFNNGIFNTPSTGIWVNGTTAAYNRGNTIEKNHIDKSGAEGMRLLQIDGNILNNAITFPTTTGIYARDSCSRYLSTVVYNAGTNGFDFTESQNDKVSLCEASHSGASGFYANTGYQDFNLTIIGSSAHENVVAGANFLNPSGLTLSGNAFTSNPTGIALTTPNNTQIFGNDLKGCANAVTVTGTAINLTRYGNLGDSTSITYAKMLRPVYDWNVFNEYTQTLNRTSLIPVEVPSACNATGVWISFNSPAAGNVVVGLYRDNGGTPQGGALVVQSASAAKRGANCAQIVPFTASTPIAAGMYWIAIQGDESTTKYLGTHGYSGNTIGLCPVTYDLTTYGTLSATCPAVTVAVFNQPYMMLQVAGTNAGL